MNTISEVAKHAGVSTATVSRVLNKPDVVDKETRRRVLVSIEELDYRPNHVARELASGSSRTVGVIISSFGSSYNGFLLDGIELTLRNFSFHTIVESSRGTKEGEDLALRSLQDRGCSSIILHSDLQTDEELQCLLERVPSVFILNRFVDGFEARSLGFDNKLGAMIAIQHLIDAGHRRIATIEGSSKVYSSRARGLGYQAALVEHGLDYDPALVITGNYSFDTGREAMRKLLELKELPTAVFVHNDEMAFGAIEVCGQHNVAVPGDISVVGFDDVPAAALLTPGLTTIKQPLAEIGAASAEISYKYSTGKVDENYVSPKFQPALIERGTVRVL